MTLFIHAGMHKTGSTSIQWTFSALKNPNLIYVPYQKTNHSELFALLFHPNPGLWPSLKDQGLSNAALIDLREKRLKQFRDLITDSRHSDSNILFSAEYISVASEHELEAFNRLIQSCECSFRILVYVRPPYSLMNSSFQQRLKAGELVLSEPHKLWPNYRKRIERLEKVFGSDSVDIRLFSPKSLVEGCAVRDLASYLNIPLPAERVISTNKTLSAEAIALLYVSRMNRSSQFGDARINIHKNYLLARSLREVGSKKLLLGLSLLEPVIEPNISELEWLADRLGLKTIIDSEIYTQNQQSNLVTVESINDLEELAEQAASELKLIIKRRIMELGHDATGIETAMEILQLLSC